MIAPLRPFPSHLEANRSLFSNVLNGLQDLGLINYSSRKGAFSFTPITQDFEIAMVDRTASLGLRAVTNSSTFILADLNPYAEISDNSNRINIIRNNFPSVKAKWASSVPTVNEHVMTSACSSFLTEPLVESSRLLCQVAFNIHRFPCPVP